MDALGALFILFGFLLWLAIAVLWVWNLVEVLVTPQARWEAAGQSKGLWFGVLVGSLLVGLAVVGSLLYLLVARPRLRRAAVLT